jgi:hypothetical protein
MQKRLAATAVRRAVMVMAPSVVKTTL